MNMYLISLPYSFRLMLILKCYAYLFLPICTSLYVSIYLYNCLFLLWV
jgi:hypothetical protein